MGYPHLPPELIIHILELSYFTIKGTIDHSTLRHCSLICAIWRDPAQQLLFRHLDLERTRLSVRRLKELFGPSPRGRTISSYVRRIAIELTNTESATAAYKTHDFLPIISLFPILYELNLSCYSQEMHADLTQHLRASKTNKTPLPKIRSLRMDAFEVPAFGEGSLLLYEVLSLWPSVQFLTYNCAHPLPLPPPERPPGLQLLEISYNAEPILEALQWLIPDHTLRFLRAKGGVGGTTRSLCIREGKYLRSVRFLLLDRVSTSLLALCPDLEELDVSRIVPHALDSAETLQHIPNTIYHVRIRDPIRFLPSVLVLLSRLPNLRILTFPVFVEEAMLQQNRREVFEEIKRVCLERNVCIARDPSPVHLEDDPVIVDRFPRGRSASNFRLMN